MALAGPVPGRGGLDYVATPPCRARLPLPPKRRHGLSPRDPPHDRVWGQDKGPPNLLMKLNSPFPVLLVALSKLPTLPEPQSPSL